MVFNVVFHSICKRTHQGRVACIRLSLGKKLSPREASSSVSFGTSTWVLMNGRKESHRANMTGDSMGRNLPWKAHYMKGKAEKNKITFKVTGSLTLLIKREKKLTEGRILSAPDQPQCFYNELWMWVIPKVPIRLWNIGQRQGHTPSLSLSLSEIPPSDHLI